MQDHEEQGVVHLKKALAAAPKGRFVPAIQAKLRQHDHAKKPAADE